MSLNQNIVIIDYDIGNISSIFNSINFLGYKNIKVSSNEIDIKKSDLIILPGVGAFKEAINNIKNRSLDYILNEAVILNKKPILGICVGMQLLSNGSEEDGWHDGFGWIKGKVKKFNLTELFIPHVGWNDIEIPKENFIFSKLNDKNFYFDHSYYFETENCNVTSYCSYGIKFASSVQKDNIFGLQFHPEKSYKNGLKIFRNFFNLVE